MSVTDMHIHTDRARPRYHLAAFAFTDDTNFENSARETPYHALSPLGPGSGTSTPSPSAAIYFVRNVFVRRIDSKEETGIRIDR